MRAWTPVFAARTTACIFVAAVFVGGCGGSSGSEVADRAKSALRAVETDLERLAGAVDVAEPQERATLLEVQAAAQRASDALGDARRSLRDLEDTEDIEPEALRELRNQVSAVRDLQELTDALGTTKLSPARVQAASARARLALDDLGTAIDVPPIAGDVLAQSLRRHAARGRANSARTGKPSAPVGSTGDRAGSGTTSYTQYRGPAFQARVPTGSGWGSPSASEPTPDRLFRTNIRGPDGLFVIIDYTPFETAKFGGSARSRTVIGQTAFGQAVRYEFQGGRLPECQRSTCFDYIINDRSTGQGFAVLAGGGSEAADIARTVAESVTPTG